MTAIGKVESVADLGALIRPSTAGGRDDAGRASGSDGHYQELDDPHGAGQMHSEYEDGADRFVGTRAGNDRRHQPSLQEQAI